MMSSLDLVWIELAVKLMLNCCALFFPVHGCHFSIKLGGRKRHSFTVRIVIINTNVSVNFRHRFLFL